MEGEGEKGGERQAACMKEHKTYHCNSQFHLYNSRWDGAVVTAFIDRVISEENEILHNHHNGDVDQAYHTKDATRARRERERREPHTWQAKLS